MIFTLMYTNIILLMLETTRDFQCYLQILHSTYISVFSFEIFNL